jgi:hypothetical protein
MKKIFILFIVVTSVALSSCNQWIDYSLNDNPNNPLDATPNLLIAPIQTNQGWLQGSQLGRISTMMTQQVEGVDRQQLGFYTYLFTTSDLEDAWGMAYNNGLTNINILLKKTAGTPNLVYYRGVTQVMRVLAIGALTDTWGDVPFSQASDPDNPNFAPKYDSQQDIYTQIQAILDSAITNLGTTGGLKVGNDVIYNGNNQQWIKLAWTLKARYAIHLTKRQGNAAATTALGYLAKGIQANADNAFVPFGNSDLTANPIYQFQQSRAGDLQFGSTLKSFMSNLNDPRLVPFGTGKSTFPGFGPYYASQAAAMPICLLAETKFIEAEANQRLGNNAAAKTSYVAAITASLQQVGVSASDITAYLAQSSVVPSGDVSLRQIMEQKWIAMFAQPETWTDWRRTGFPVLTAAKGTRIPRRVLTPNTELNLNRANIPAGGTDGQWAYTSVWWDQ